MTEKPEFLWQLLKSIPNRTSFLQVQQGHTVTKHSVDKTDKRILGFTKTFSELDILETEIGLALRNLYLGSSPFTIQLLYSCN